MTHNVALKHKSDCILAYLRGEKVEINTTRDNWEVITEPDYTFNYSGHRYRIAPKPEPKLPPGMFWVRENGKDSRLCHWMIIQFASDGASFYHPGTGFPYTAVAASDRYHWSRDRVTWFTFDNHDTPVTQ